MDTFQSLQKQLHELVDAQAPAIRQLAQSAFDIPGILASPVYGLILRRPHIFIELLRVQLDPQASGEASQHESSGSEADDKSREVDELRKRIKTHLRRIDPRLPQSLTHTRLTIHPIAPLSHQELLYQFTSNCLHLMAQGWVHYNEATNEDWVSEIDRRPWWMVGVLESFVAGTIPGICGLSGVSELFEHKCRDWLYRIAKKVLRDSASRDPIIMVFQQFRQHARIWPRLQCDAVPDSRIAPRRGWQWLSIAERNFFLMLGDMIYVESNKEALYPGLYLGYYNCNKMGDDFASDVWNGYPTTVPSTSYAAQIQIQLKRFISDHQQAFDENLAALRWLHSLPESPNAEAWNTQLVTEAVMSQLHRQDQSNCITKHLGALNMEKRESSVSQSSDTGKKDCGS